MTSALDHLPIVVATANPLAHLLNGDHLWALAFGALLLGISLFAWSVIVSKTMGLRRSDKTDRVFLQRFRESAHPLQIFGTHASSHGSVLHSVYCNGARELTYHWLGSSEVDDSFEPRLRRAKAMSKRETTLFRARLKRIASEAGTALEKRMSSLTWLVNCVPLLGLLATAWALMAAFGASQATTLSASAATGQPSIGTSLSLSVLALLVAVPAGIGTRYLRDHLRRKVREIRLFCDEFDATISTSYHNATTEEAQAPLAETPSSRQSPPASEALPDIESELEMGALAKVAPHPETPPPGVAAAKTLAPAPASVQSKPLEFVPTDATAISGQQLTFETASDSCEFDDEPEINPVARQTAVQAPGLMFEAQQP